MGSFGRATRPVSVAGHLDRLDKDGDPLEVLGIERLHPHLTCGLRYSDRASSN